MSEFRGMFRMAHDEGPGLNVVIDLEDEQVLLKTGTSVLGRWPLTEIGVRGGDDGFHLRIEGEEAIFSTDEDVAFALAVGLHSASPRLRRRMGAFMSEYSRESGSGF